MIYHFKLEEERGPGEHDVGPPVDGDGGEHEAVERVPPGQTQSAGKREEFYKKKHFIPSLIY